MTHSPASLVWLRRDLRLHDHAALAAALAAAGPIQPVFVFDTDILRLFPNPADRRVSFFAGALVSLNAALCGRGGSLLVLHGSAREVMPQLARALGARHLFAAEDYEPGARRRDQAVAGALKGKADIRFVKDQLVFSPLEILRSDGNPYKVLHLIPTSGASSSRRLPQHPTRLMTRVGMPTACSLRLLPGSTACGCSTLPRGRRQC